VVGDQISGKEWKVRRLSSVRWLIVIALTLVSTSVVIAIASASIKPGRPRATLPLAQLVALAHSTASGLNDPRAKTALVVATTKHAAEEWLEPGAISPGAADPRAYLIVLKGRFICTRCSYPAGAKPPRGRSVESIWVPGQGVGDFGLTQNVPGGLDKLGRIVKINLLALAVTAPDLARTQHGTYHRCRREHLSVRGTEGGWLNLTNLRVIRISCSRAAAAVRASSYEASPAGPLFTSPGFSCSGPVGPPPPGARPRYYHCNHRRQMFEFLVPGFS
jgi:hypothetical protein